MLGFTNKFPYFFASSLLCDNCNTAYISHFRKNTITSRNSKSNLIISSSHLFCKHLYRFYYHSVNSVHDWSKIIVDKVLMKFSHFFNYFFQSTAQLWLMTISTLWTISSIHITNYLWLLVARNIITDFIM